MIWRLAQGRGVARGFLFLGSALVSSGQLLQVAAPKVGVVFDPPTRSVRAIVGYPRSSFMGEAVLDGLDQAFPSPDGSMAIAMRGDAILAAYGVLTGVSLNAAPDGTMAKADRVLWSADSSSVYLWSGLLARVQRLQRRGDLLVPGAQIDLGSSGANLVAWASDRTGANLVVALKADDATVALNLVASEQSPVPLGSVADASAILFAASGRDAYVLDRVTPQVFAFRNLSGTPTLESLMQPLCGSEPATGMGISPDQKSFYFISSQAKVCAYDAASFQQTSEQELDSAPEGMEPLGDGPYLLLARRRNSADALMLLDRRSAEVSYVPAPAKN